MDFSLLTLLALGGALGVKHAMEPDHVVAVSAIASKSNKLWRASLAGAFWGIGHTATLFAVGMFLIVTKAEIPEKWAMLLEFCVGVMIVFLGVRCLADAMSSDRRSPSVRAGRGISYRDTMLVGVLHGFAGSAAMVLLTMSLMEHIWQGALFILVFGAGTAAGMLLATTLIGLPFVMSAGKARLNRILVGFAGTFSVLFGLYYMYNIGIYEGLLTQWLP